MKKLSLIIPSYNEEGNITLFYEEALFVLSDLKYKLEFVFINDGSNDSTEGELNLIHKNDKKRVKVITFSRNFGKESAIYAGLEHCTGDYAVIIDADMQQPPRLIVDMLEVIEADSNYDAVAYFQDHRSDPKILKFLKNIFYKLMNKISEVEFEKGASDFRLINRKMINSVLSLPEKNRFSKGLFSWIGFNYCYLPYKAEERKYGKTKWSFLKLLNYAISGITSFSNIPLRVSTYLGVLFSGFSLIYFIVVIIQKLFFGIALEGYATIVGLILLLGGVQLMVLGIIGEYIAKIYTEVKGRPIYIEKEIKAKGKKND